ncbi:MAG: SAM-dependent DNA methyltransferase [Sphingobacteriales bacterium]|nr:SAM-dependent DNA methyltransferase [Sphingobacteriales bacterium]
MTNISGTLKSIRDIMWQDTGLNGDAQRIEQLGWMLFLKIFSDKDLEMELMDSKYKSPIPPQFHWDKWAGNDEGMTGDELLEFVDRKLFPALRNINVSTGNQRALIVREVFEGNNNYMKSGINIRKVLNKLNEIDFNKAKDRHAFGELYENILKELQSAGKSGEFYTPRAITQFITDMIDPKLGEKILDPACGTGGFLTCAIEHLMKQANSVEDRQSIAENLAGWEYKPLPYLLATTNLILHDIEVPNITFRDALDQPLTNYTEKHRVNAILANPPFGGIVANNNEANFPQTYRTKESADLFLILMIHLVKQGGRAGIVLPDGSLTGEGIKQRVRQRLLEECNLHTIIRLPNSVFQPYATVATNLLFFEKGKPTKEIWYYEHRMPEGYKAYSKTKPIQVKEFDPIKKWWKKRKASDVCWKVDIQTIKDRGFDLDIKNPTKKEEKHEYNSAELMEMLRQSFLKSEKLLNQLKEAVK